MKDACGSFGRTLVVVLSIVTAGLSVADGRRLGVGDSDDDRPPIIVSNGSLKIEGGDPADPDKPKNWRDWSKDLFGEHWKPKDDNAHGVASFAVTITGVASNSLCAVPNLGGDDVVIEYATGPAPGAPRKTARFYIATKIGFPGFLKREPKLDASDVPPKLLPATANAPAALVYDEGGQGYITSITTGGFSCSVPADAATRSALRIRIQPKRKH